jgi:hypothetical protein
MKNKLELIDNKIYLIRGQQVMLDFDLAELYGSETAQLKRAVRRNAERFEGEDFMFELSQNEIKELSRCQIGILNTGRGSNIKYAPFAFTELGVAMLSSVLRSDVAVEVNRGIMRAFVKVRQLVQYTASPVSELSEIKKQIQELKEDFESLNKDHEVYENQFDELFKVFGDLSLKLQISQERAERKPIEGFRNKDGK